MKRVLLSLVFTLSFITLFSQTTIWQEDFTYADGTTTGTPPSDWTITPGGSPDYFEVRSNQLVGKELDGQNVWQSEIINIPKLFEIIWINGQSEIWITSLLFHRMVVKNFMTSILIRMKTQIF